MSTNKQRKLYAERLRQLGRLGFATPLEHQLLSSEPPEVLVAQCGDPVECPIFDLQERGTLYVVWLSVAPKRP